ncbi:MULTISPECIES: CBS domain-containing protein [Shinella]|jgi:CBS domain-containing protein|uniref:CBS domain protein n=1 Tax=Shinella granuli TaxID=323621 RepID=A0A4R2CL08_SHIGR|nr:MULTISPECIES: CBS domain-containing protein [Shinella]MCA0338540.1 CBS domain-containing protein [Pseudomonadota bacterium]ANH04048.1 inosine-5-monophosphate dehydrogenase [Shinella sp. HZN7]EYR80963.1 putative signal-transduction protein [Shinella sp. DD12]KNY16817.1 inosine-5-monophosphate dehydrogenase [Shinella sp. SUS2]KOC73295.1 inosine-5-monophosphate dehydrogenase [Shinella sp. GWS1]
MYVKTILDEKGRNVVTGGPQLTVRQAAVYLHENHIGAIVILDRNDRIAGIATERDIVAAVARNGAECLDKPISSIMWGNVHRCGENQTVDELMEMMSTLRARHIPVEKDGRLVGIISIGDVVKSHIRAIQHEADAIKAYIAG